MDLTKSVLYRDAMMIVLDKPAGMPVHRGGRLGQALDDYFDGLRFGLKTRPELAHRLDSDTSGCLVLGRHRRALARLGALFQTAKIEKTYWALVTAQKTDASPLQDFSPDSPPDSPPDSWQKISGFLRKISSKAEGWRIEICDADAPDAKPAETWWRLRGQCSAEENQHMPPGFCLYWLELQPKTGRTHQLRVHCASLLAPILGDRHYGGCSLNHFISAQNWRGIGLVAKHITIPLYADKPPIRVEAPLPAALEPWFAACGWQALAEA